MVKKSVKIFLDSNVILSGLISDKGAPRTILDLLSLNLPITKGITGEYNIMEIERTLARKLPAAIPVYEQYFPKLSLIIIPLPSRTEVEKYEGHIVEKDVPVLVSAIKAGVDYLVTGDKKDFDAIKNKGQYPFQIISPAEFIDVIAGIIKP